MPDPQGLLPGSRAAKGASVPRTRPRTFTRPDAGSSCRSSSLSSYRDMRDKGESQEGSSSRDMSPQEEARLRAAGSRLLSELGLQGLHGERSREPARTRC